ncbi:hypothetical protein [Paraferrimonas sedimenticola]|uniref:Lipoprotein n=1 Tax=Paraferrimonas sedimenticola TaxID=375674 RepID=A0AA37VU49_9GAMM|nr:hypothetical protein [Paraferrimonas sedimenticola]GLP95486.1 hypothetical protein GCM10007895_07920 [Paraferrimonas sedimenticola]
MARRLLLSLGLVLGLAACSDDVNEFDRVSFTSPDMQAAYQQIVDSGNYETLEHITTFRCTGYCGDLHELAQLPNLGSLYLDKGQIRNSDDSKVVDLSELPNVFDFHSDGFLFEELKLADGNRLHEIELVGTGVNQMDLSETINLSRLTIHQSTLAYLDLSKQFDLWKVDIQHSDLKVLKFDIHPDLLYLTVTHSPLSTLNLEGMPWLNWVDLSDTRIRTLNTEFNLELSRFIANNTWLRTIRFYQNSYLYRVEMKNSRFLDDETLFYLQNELPEDVEVILE